MQKNKTTVMTVTGTGPEALINVSLEVQQGNNLIYIVYIYQNRNICGTTDASEGVSEALDLFLCNFAFRGSGAARDELNPLS